MTPPNNTNNGTVDSQNTNSRTKLFKDCWPIGLGIYKGKTLAITKDNKIVLVEL